MSEDPEVIVWRRRRRSDRVRQPEEGFKVKLSLKALGPLLHDWDFANRAKSYGARGGREVLVHAIKNLPTNELNQLRPHLEKAISDAVERTTNDLIEFGIDPDEFPPKIRAGTSEPRE